MDDGREIPALELKGVSKDFGPGAFCLQAIDLTIDRGEVFGIIGPNGSGKTTLLRAMAGLLTPDSGTVLVAGDRLNRKSPTARARSVAYVPQEAAVTFPFTVQEVVLMGRFPYLGWLGFEKAHDIEVARWALEVTETDHLKNRVMGDLSGGERQRVVLAMALAQEPTIVLLDEPTSFLDIKHQVNVHRLLVRLREERQLTVVSVLHDLTMASTWFDRLCLMAEGRVKKVGPPAEVIEYQLIKETYETEVYIDVNAVTGRPYIIPLPIRTGWTVPEGMSHPGGDERS